MTRLLSDIANAAMVIVTGLIAAFLVLVLIALFVAFLSRDFAFLLRDFALDAATPPAVVYTFARAELRDCHDGDTCRFDLHDAHPVFGAVTWRGTAVRLAGIDAPEIGARARCPAEAKLAGQARARLVALIEGAQSLTIEIVSKRRDKYGRLVGRVLADGQDVGALLIAENLARPYTGRGKRKGWCP